MVTSVLNLLEETLRTYMDMIFSLSNAYPFINVRPSWRGQLSLMNISCLLSQLIATIGKMLYGAVGVRIYNITVVS
jgi:hypothetical protein